MTDPRADALQAVWQAIHLYKLESGKMIGEIVVKGNDKINLCNLVLDAACNTRQPPAPQDDLTSLLTKAIGDITVALIMAGRVDLASEWIAPYVEVVNRADEVATKSDAGEAVGEPAASAPPASGDTQDDLVEAVARALAKSHGLDFDEVCGVDADPDEGYCDSDTCIASNYEDHDAAYARACYSVDARAVIPIAQAPIIAERDAALAKLAAAEVENGRLRDRFDDILHSHPGAAEGIARAALATEKKP